MCASVRTEIGFPGIGDKYGGQIQEKVFGGWLTRRGR